MVDSATRAGRRMKSAQTIYDRAEPIYIDVEGITAHYAAHFEDEYKKPTVANVKAIAQQMAGYETNGGESMVYALMIGDKDGLFNLLTNELNAAVKKLAESDAEREVEKVHTFL